jgi:PAS domain S-box-containing protein
MTDIDTVRTGGSVSDIAVPPRPVTLPDASVLLEAMTEGVSLSTEDGVIVYTNRAEDRLFGYAPGELIGRHVSIQNAYPDDENRRVVAEVIDRLKANGAWEGEWRNRRKDGTEFLTASRITAIEIGGRRHWLCVQRDVTEARRTEMELAASEERLRDITDAMPVLISYVDADQRFRFANRAYEEWFRRPLAEIVGRRLRDVMDEVMYEARRPYVERALAGECVTYDAAFSGAAGERATKVQHIPHVGPGGRVLGMYALVQDVTDQTLAEAALRESRDRLQAVLDATPAAILIATDPSCADIRGNRRAAEMMRMSPSVNLSRSAGSSAMERTRILSVDGRELAAHELPVQRAARGEESWMHEEQVVFDDGTSVQLLGNAVPLRGPGGEIRGAVGAFIDISERKRAEQRQRLLVDELNHRVKNTLAIVQGIAQQSFRGTAATPEARAAFEGRLAALSVAHDLLTRQNWEAASIRQIIGDSVAAVGPRVERVGIDGPDVLLPPKTAVSLAMAVHELATNAVKYGGLSGTDGRVDVEWRIGEGRLALVWRERDGPVVTPPASRGFGTRMIERGLAAELDGRVVIAFEPTGLVCTVDAPLPATGG